jgi:DNA-directed RNA polymerase, mitochondrial
MLPTQYLFERVGKVILNSDKLYNAGAKLIAEYPEWQDNLERIVNESWDTLLRYCIRNKNATHSASVKLTFASDLIGKRIVRIIGCDNDIKNTLALGDILLESFLQDNLIEIYREYEGIKAPYMVRVTNQCDGIKPILIGTTFQPLPPITGLISEITKEPYIKGWSNNKLFQKYLDKPFVKALETLRSTAWTINKDVLDALKKNPPPDKVPLVDTDGVLYMYDIHTPNTDLPKKLMHKDGTPFLGKKDPKMQRIMSKFFEYTQVVSKAEEVLHNSDVFYQEVSCDYRGRVYYAESFLEFQGSDIARSLFLFHNKKKVTEQGFRWMLIHAANSYNQSFNISELKGMPWLSTDYVKYLEHEGLETISLDKMTLKDREEWSRRNLHILRAYAQNKVVNPDAEKPYALYAVCIDIDNYIVHEELLKKDYYSGLPVPVDGSNNGWQHLAAMSRDKNAGELVSLTPTPIQKDFYVAVAKDLIRLMPEWFEDKNISMKNIRKGIAKRGSMTRAYSAGKTRIAKNMYDDCHVEGFTVKYGITEKDTEILATNLIKAINQVCAGPLRTTKYLQKIAEHELNSGRNRLEWITPSGFPVVYKAYLQHERKQRGTIKGIKGNKDGRVMHVIRVDVLAKDTGEKVPCRRSFASGVSPNFVHSMDAAHMANTINAFNGAFAAVHDSFSTYASDVDFLQEVVKETFIAQYDVDNFFDIIQDTLMLHKDTFNVDQPSLGRLKLEDVRKSEYFFC